MTGRRFCVGVDLGQARDYTAIAVLELAEVTGEWDPVGYGYKKTKVMSLRYLERVALGTPYPEVVEQVRRGVRSADLADRCTLAADATGVGRPVLDMLRRADLRCNMLPVLITGGDTERSEDGYYRVPKRDLIVGLQVLLQQKRLQIADEMPGAAELVREMMQMRVRITTGAHEQYGAWREGEHDDLVLAVALACWSVGKVWPGWR